MKATTETFYKGYDHFVVGRVIHENCGRKKKYLFITKVESNEESVTVIFYKLSKVWLKRVWQIIKLKRKQ